MTNQNENSMRAVALACIAAERLRDARKGRSRRGLGKEIGIPGVVISDIEDASVLPSLEQVRKLQNVLGVTADELYEAAWKFGEIPWLSAIEHVLRGAGQRTTAEISKAIAHSAPNCRPEIVRWRLSRELTRLEGSGILQGSKEGQWSLRTRARSRTSLTEPKGGPRVVHKFRFEHDPERDALFHVDSTPGSREIVLNHDHPLAEQLSRIIDPRSSMTESADDLRRAVENASYVMRTLLISWSEVEEAEKSGSRRDRLREIRQEWGRVARRNVERGGDYDDPRQLP